MVKNYFGTTSKVCEKGNAEVFGLYYERYSDDIDVDIAFDYVLRSQNLSFVKYFVERFHPNINALGEKDYTPVNRACEMGNYEIFKFISEQEGVDYSIPNEYDEDCLFVCCESGNIDILKCLLANPAIDINRQHH